jgi:RecA-family ATPase
LYFDLEMMPWQNRRRLEQLISHYETSQGERIQGLSDHTIYFFDPSSMPFRCLDDKGIEAFEAEIVKHDANLVVVDTIARVFPPTLRGSNAYFAEYDFYGKLQGVAQRTESAVVLLHHENKGTKEGADPMDRASGTAAFAATVDAYLLLDRKRSVDGTPSYEGKLFCTGRLVQQRTIEVEWKDSRGFTVTSDPLLERRAKRYGEQTQLPEVVI